MKQSFLDRIIFQINLLAALLLLITYPAPFVNPQQFWFVSILGLLYPFALFINCIFILYWLLKRSAYLLFSLIVVVLGWNLLSHSFAFNLFSSPSQEPDNAVKIMSYNVQNFDLYNWNENIDSRNKMLDLIQKEEPDIICFQEFYSEDGGEFENIGHIKKLLGFKHHHFEKTLTLREKDHWGISVFSKYPIVKTNKLNFENPKLNVATFTDISIQDKTIRLFNGHLQSYHLGREDMKYVKSLRDQATGKKSDKKGKEPDHLKSSSSILKKLRNAYIKRSTQAEVMAEAIANSPHPVVVCGDFNDTPASYAYHKIADNLQDAFLKKGFGFGGTYSGPLPSFRIDYILTSPSVEIQEFDIIEADYSDHYPVSCVLVF